MDVPLIVDPIVKYGKEKFRIWYNGQVKEVDCPLKPYFYSDRKLGIETAVKATKVKGIALSDYMEKTFYKYEFQTRDDLKKAKGEHTFEDNVPFILRHRIDIPKVFRRYPHKNPIKFLFLDIEQFTKEGEMFPTYDDRITAISWCGNNRNIMCGYLKKDTMSDRKLLDKFLQWYEDYQPDVIVCYNKSYDIVTLLKRCQKNRIDTARFAKSNQKPYIGGKADIHIDGVVIYDAFESAQADQSLTGNVVNRGLKEVSNWFGFKEKRKPLTPQEMTKFIGTRKLVEYNKDDVRRLLTVFDVYWTNIEFNANDLSIPLSEAIYMNITDLGLIVEGDAFRERNIIADGANEDRFPEIFKRKKGKEEPNYQGAIVDIYRTGVFEPVFKADYSSMYPTIMASFNLSPDTTSLLHYAPLSDFKIEEEKDSFIYHIPDKALQKTMVIKVSKQPGFAAEIVQRFLDERAEYKKAWKQTGNKKFKALSDNRKVKANGGMYGIQGSAKHAFGFAPIAIAVTGIGRQCAQLLMDVLNELSSNSVIETDTDGVYYTAENVSEEQVIKRFQKRLEEKFPKKLKLSIDVDSYDKGYFYKAKNYVLKKGDKLIFHGGAMKASSKNDLSRNLIYDLAEAKFSEEDTKPIIRRYKRLEFPLEDFAMSKRMGMHWKQYKRPESTIVCRLAKDAEEFMGRKPEIGNQYHYIKALHDFKLLEVSTKQDIDRKYYEKQIDKIVKMFDIEPAAPSLKKWGI